MTRTCPHGIRWNYSCDDCEKEDSSSVRSPRTRDHLIDLLTKRIDWYAQQTFPGFPELRLAGLYGFIEGTLEASGIRLEHDHEWVPWPVTGSRCALCGESRSLSSP